MQKDVTELILDPLYIQNTLIKFFLIKDDERCGLEEINKQLYQVGMGDYLGVKRFQGDDGHQTILIDTEDVELSYENDKFIYLPMNHPSAKAEFHTALALVSKYLQDQGYFARCNLSFDYASIIMGYIYWINIHRPYYYFEWGTDEKGEHIQKLREQSIRYKTIVDCISDYRYQIFGRDCCDRDMAYWITVALVRYGAFVEAEIKGYEENMGLKQVDFLKEILHPESQQDNISWNKFMINDMLWKHIEQNVLSFGNRDF